MPSEECRCLRATYLKDWYRCIRKQKLNVTAREITAGVLFLLRDLVKGASSIPQFVIGGVPLGLDDALSHLPVYPTHNYAIILLHDNRLSFFQNPW